MTAYLLDHPNTNAPDRGDGRYWGYPTRRGHRPEIGVLHTAENVPDIVWPDNGAESVAHYFATNTRPASYHRIVDSDSRIELLPLDHVAFGSKHARRMDGAAWNNIGVHLSMATRAAAWATVPDWWKPAILDRAAIELADINRTARIPLTLVTGDDAHNGLDGWTTHGYLDPVRRSDPGMTDAELRALLDLARRHRDGRVGDQPGDVVARIPVDGVPHRSGRWPTLIVTADGIVAAANGARWVGDLWQFAPNEPRRARPLELNAPIVDAVAYRGGYTLIGADGGTFAFGMRHPGSLGGIKLAAPIESGAIVHRPDGSDVLVMTAGDGGTFAFPLG